MRCNKSSRIRCTTWDKLNSGNGNDCNPYPYRPLDKDNNANERLLQQNYWWEHVNRSGTRVEYYTYNYQTSAHDYLYGEQPLATFTGPANINVVINLPTDALLLSKFGLQTNADFTGIMAIKDFRDVFGNWAEPKAGDLIRLVEAGWREQEFPTTSCDIFQTPTTFTTAIPVTSFMRCPQLFEITERLWQDFSINANPLLGHYVWILKGKRFDYSYQPGIIPECRNGIVGDDTLTGVLSGGVIDPNIQNPQPEKPYPGNADDNTRDDIWDYKGDTRGDESRNTNPYGEY